MNEQTPFNPNKSSTQENRVLSDSDLQNEIAEVLAQNETKLFEGVHGLPTLDEAGEVTLFTHRRTSPQSPEKLATKLSRKPLYEYTDEKGQHVISLYASEVTSRYPEDEADRIGSRTLFAVEQLIHPDQHSNPQHEATAVFYNDETAYSLLIDEPNHLMTALYDSLGGMSGILKYVRAHQQGAEATETDAKLEQALRLRRSDSADTHPLSFKYWEEHRITSDEHAEVDRLVEGYKREDADLHWAQASLGKRALARLAWHLSPRDQRPDYYKDQLYRTRR